MAVSGDISVGANNDKIHPYLVTLVRWCVSCVWSTATVFLHRLLSTPLQPIAGPKPAPARAKPPVRVPGTEHLHPEPRVECQLLHQPDVHTMDVIFVHGLYGSLGNTWRQGDWRQKYTSEPTIVTLIDHSEQNACKCQEKTKNNDNKCNANDTKSINDNKCVEQNLTDLNESDLSINNITEKLSKKIIPQENDLITEQFYNNTLRDQNDDKYNTRANFVSDMFKKETNCDKCCENNTIEQENEFKCNSDDNFKCNNSTDAFKYEINDNKCDQDQDSDNSLKSEETNDDFKCKFNEVNEFDECKCQNAKKCEVGCGCICNECYSTCWPRDWIKEDFPGARVISINYTSDPYLWRPLWIKENKRLNLYQRADQMIEQLLEMGVGEKPIVWVGHSKGGLFIKQIYCQAYEAYLKTNKNVTIHDEIKEFTDKKTDENLKDTNEMTAGNIDTIIGHFKQEKEAMTEKYSKCDSFTVKNDNITGTNDKMTQTNDNETNFNNLNENESRTNIIHTQDNRDKRINHDNYDFKRQNNNYTRNIQNIMNNNSCVMNEIVEYENIFENLSANDNLEYTNVINDNIRNLNIEKDSKMKDLENGGGNQDLTSSIEDMVLTHRARLWSSSRGFMFYSVPHRGSPLADIKTPLTARSIDLQEIAKECPLVMELQARWRRAAAHAPVAVRGAVESSRTLMSVLWLRIVSARSADAGLGSLYGVSVDHREICKPRSRTCRLYTLLTDLIQEAMLCGCTPQVGKDTGAHDPHQSV